MFGTQQCGVKADMKVGIGTGSASPRQRIVMLSGAAGSRAPHSPPPEAPQP